MDQPNKRFISGKLIKRYKRFFADVQLDNTKQIVTAHCPNTGSMLGLLKEGNPVRLTKVDDKKRKLKFTLEIIKSGGANIGVNTHRANRIVEEALISNKIKSLKKIINLKREVKYGESSRIDFLINNNNDEEIYIEVKNVTLSLKEGIAEFPDAITERGSKHLKELQKIRNKKTRAIMLYLVQRDDCKYFRIAKEIDEKYNSNLKKAIKSGVEILCYNCKFENNKVKMDKKIKFIKK
jgi:sugar fermentation stimulation protein A